MTEITATLTVKRPLWLRAALKLATIAIGIRYLVTGSMTEDAELNRLSRWYVKHLRLAVTLDPGVVAARVEPFNIDIQRPETWARDQWREAQSEKSSTRVSA